MTAALVIVPPLVGEFVLTAAPLPASADPVQAYLDTLGASSQETMRSSLRAVARLIGAPSPEAIPWGAWRYEHTARVRSLLEQLGPESYRTANRHLAALKGVLKAAKKMKLLGAQDYSDAVDVKPIAGESELGGREIAEAELVKLFAACDLKRPRGLQQGLALALLFGGGLRLSEPTRLRPEDYDRASGRLSVRGKGNKQRHVQLPEGARRATEAWLAIRGDWPGALLAPVRKTGEVLQRGLTPRALAKSLTELAERAGVLELQSHDFRRTYATTLFRLHVDPLLICGLMGHASLETTMRYDYRPEEARAEAANKLHVPYPEKPKR